MARSQFFGSTKKKKNFSNTYTFERETIDSSQINNYEDVEEETISYKKGGKEWQETKYTVPVRHEKAEILVELLGEKKIEGLRYHSTMQNKLFVELPFDSSHHAATRDIIAKKIIDDLAVCGSVTHRMIIITARDKDEERFILNLFNAYETIQQKILNNLESKESEVNQENSSAQTEEVTLQPNDSDQPDGNNLPLMGKGQPIDDETYNPVSPQQLPVSPSSLQEYSYFGSTPSGSFVIVEQPNPAGKKPN